VFSDIYASLYIAGYCDLKPLINGEINYNGNNTVTSVAVGETVEVRCFEGFRLSTIRTQLVQLTCQANGSWTDSLHTVAFPVCESKYRINREKNVLRRD
jgi:hypothetical protein